MNVFKLTDANLRTCGGCQWVLGETRRSSGEGELCGPGWLHCYRDLIVGLFMNPIHGLFRNPRAFEAEARGNIKDDADGKTGCTELTLTKEIESVPEITLEQRLRFGILCAREVYHEAKWVRWSERWLSGRDRSWESADAARLAVHRAAARSKTPPPLWSSVVYAAEAAATTARAAAYVSISGGEVECPEEVFWVLAIAAATAAESAALAEEAEAAEMRSVRFDINKFAHQAII